MEPLLKYIRAIQVVTFSIILAFGVFTLYTVGHPETTLGAALRTFTSEQLADSPVNSYVLSTDGTNNSWIVNTGGGGGGGSISTSSPATIGRLLSWSGVNTVTSTPTTTLTGTAPISFSNAISVIGNTPSIISCVTATGSVAGCLAAADWTSFNNKVSSTSIDTSAELDALVTDQTGSAGSLVFSVAPTLTGLTTLANYTASNGTTTNATSTNMRISNSLSFGGVVGTAWTDFCTTITGGAGLCDGSDATGGAGGTDVNWSYTSGNTFISPATTTNGIRVSASSTIGNGTGAGGLTIDGGATTTGEVVLRESSNIVLDAIASADGVYTGTTMYATAGEALAFGDVVYLNSTTTTWKLTDANSAVSTYGDSRNMIGMVVVAAGGNGSTTKLLLNGTIRADANFPTFATGTPIYISETAGDTTGTQPTTADVVIRIIGFAKGQDELYFNPSNDYITHI